MRWLLKTDLRITSFGEDALASARGYLSYRIVSSPVLVASTEAARISVALSCWRWAVIRAD